MRALILTNPLRVAYLSAEKKNSVFLAERAAGSATLTRRSSGPLASGTPDPLSGCPSKLLQQNPLGRTAN